ncbi:hypothetical protein HDV05_003006, partial [Chytridiales sp. JEL 0842]
MASSKNDPWTIWYKDVDCTQAVTSRKDVAPGCEILSPDVRCVKGQFFLLQVSGECNSNGTSTNGNTSSSSSGFLCTMKNESCILPMRTVNYTVQVDAKALQGVK